MNTEAFIAVCAAIGTGITVLTIVFTAGTTRGIIGARLDEHERRLDAIEKWLKALGIDAIARSKGRA